MKKLSTTILGAAVLVAAVMVGGGEAHAQACGSVADQAEGVFDAFVDTYGLAFPIPDAAACEKLAKAAVSACHKAVSETAGCIGGVIGGILKGAKPVCSTFKNETGCNDGAKELAAEDRSQLEEDSDAAHDECDLDLGESIADVCLEGFPM